MGGSSGCGGGELVGRHISNFGTVNEDKGPAGRLDGEGGSILITDNLLCLQVHPALL